MSYDPPYIIVLDALVLEQELNVFYKQTGVS